jgi:hypothetical protein
MKKTKNFLLTKIQTTPFFGRTFVVLSFFFLIIKQILLILTYKEAFQEATFWVTLSHYF